MPFLRNTPAVVLLVVYGCGSGSGCKDYLLQRERSPGGQWDAVAYVRGCGAVTRPVANVSLVRAGTPLPDAPGNVLRIDEPAVMGEKEGDIILRWRARDTLVISYRAGRTAVMQERAHKGITVLYESP